MTKGMKRLFMASAAVSCLAGAAWADACSDALAGFRTSLAGDRADILSAAEGLRTGGVCNAVTTQRAMQQASAALARKAQALVAAKDLSGAQQMLDGAPALHWAVQAVRADIAAAEGKRTEAAQLYNAALDTISDPALTPPDPRLSSVAERIARLAQENMMLAGTLSPALTRGGAASGVLRAAVRGIAIEPVPTAKPQAPAHTPQAVPAADPYAGAPQEDYVVADAVAKTTKAVFLPIRFAFNSADLDAAGIYEAETVANFLKSNHISQITIQGHTDEIGSDAFNLDLSLRRAITVRDFFLHHGVTAYIDVEGKGEREPPKLVDPFIYSDEERRAIARRVELVLQG